MGLRSDTKFAKKHDLAKDYGYGALDQLVYVGETTFHGGPSHFFKKGWPAFAKAPIVNPQSGTVSNLRSTSNNDRVSVAYSWIKTKPGGTGWLYLVWCRRGFEYRPIINAVGGRGEANDEVVMVGIEGYHVLAAREVIRTDDDTATLGAVVENDKSKLKTRDFARYQQAVQDLAALGPVYNDLQSMIADI